MLISIFRILFTTIFIAVGISFPLDVRQKQLKKIEMKSTRWKFLRSQKLTRPSLSGFVPQYGWWRERIHEHGIP